MPSWLDENSMLVAKCLGLFGCYFAGLFLATILHELGHAVAALALTSQRVRAQVGSEGGVSLQLGRLKFSISLKGGRYGETRYARAQESRWTQTFVALCGPVSNSLALTACIWGLLQQASGSLPWIILLAFAVANFRILIVALWPIAYRPDPRSQEEWLSDGLDVWRMWRGKR